jgi:dihydrofolate synthase/folylpolyglutamate synthase
MVMHGWEATRWPGRLEIISQDPLVVIDVGHTPGAITAALEGFREICGVCQSVLVCGASHDKDLNAIVATLAQAFSVVVCTSPRHKGAPASLIAKHAAAANPSAEIVVADSCTDARRVALARARATGAATYVAGGLFLAAEFKAVHSGRDAATLAFF